VPVGSDLDLTLLIICILAFEPFVFNTWDDAVLELNVDVH